MFNILLSAALEPVIIGWAKRGFGIAFEDDHPRINALVWGANIFIIAKNTKEFRVMSAELSAAVYSYNLVWKA